MSMTDYASLVDEQSDNKNHLIDIAKDTIKPVGLISHHNQQKKDKPVRPLKDIRNSRLDEIKGAIPGKAKGGADPSRTLQPVRGFDLGALQKEEEKKEAENKKKVDSI